VAALHILNTAFALAVGGRSILEASGELRFRVTDSFGLAAFVDAGNVYESPTPDLTEELFFGSGIGGRYYTAIGPLRLDITTPLNGRDRDDLIQIYVSIGETY
jgi:translocation and assembly module TamA